jgi:hypothetical protein
MRCSGPWAISAALVLSFDNLGEASELERGGFDARSGSGSGEHPSVLEALPWLLDTLDSNGLSATFFIEAINCELYPDAVRGIASRGHEVGLHGWQHERWGSLPVDRERSILERSVSAFEALGIQVSGFRPPGGELTSASPALLRSVGVKWCSPAAGAVGVGPGGAVGVRDGAAFGVRDGAAFGVREGLIWVPFEWELVDAYHLMDSFAELRASRGAHREPLPARSLATRFGGAVRELVRSGSRATLVLHPFLMLDAAWRDGVAGLLAEIAALARGGGLWVGPGGALASRLATAH